MFLFGKSHKLLDKKDIIEKGLFNNSQSFLKYNENNCTKGFNFNGTNIQERFDNFTYLSINSLNKFSYASFEELRLADYEKTQTGNIEKYKIIDTSGTIKKNLNFENISFASNIFGQNNNNSSLFGVNNQNNSTGLFGNNNQSNNKSLFGVNNQNNIWK